MESEGVIGTEKSMHSLNILIELAINEKRY